MAGGAPGFRLFAWDEAMNDTLTLISVAGLLLLLGCVALRVFVLNRRAAGQMRERARLLEERRKKEEEIMRQVREIRGRDDLGNARAAVNRDPERAAKVVGKMMRK